MGRTEVRIVDDSTFLLGLDELYRARMKHHESGELLASAREVSRILGLAPASVPIEGYYTETPALEEYFRRLRALQGEPASRAGELASSPAFRRLVEVTGSPIFGCREPGTRLLPTSADSLTRAMRDLFPHWTLDALVDRAFERAVQDDDCSLVGLAARARNPIVLASLAESVVLYREAAAMASLRPPQPVYEWRVHEELERAAQHFVSEFHALFGHSLPEPGADNAAAYWHAAADSDPVGRCVRIGSDDTVDPVRHYHWGVFTNRFGKTAVAEFWSTELWTTERYRAALRHPVAHGLRPHDSG